MLAIFTIYRLKFLIFLVFLFLSSFYTNAIQSNEIDLEKDTYYYEKLAEKWDDIFPDGNRNAAGPKFFKFLIEQDWIELGVMGINLVLIYKGRIINADNNWIIYKRL